MAQLRSQKEEGEQKLRQMMDRAAAAKTHWTWVLNHALALASIRKEQKMIFKTICFLHFH